MLQWQTKNSKIFHFIQIAKSCALEKRKLYYIFVAGCGHQKNSKTVTEPLGQTALWPLLTHLLLKVLVAIVTMSASAVICYQWLKTGDIFNYLYTDLLLFQRPFSHTMIRSHDLTITRSPCEAKVAVRIIARSVTVATSMVTTTNLFVTACSDMKNPIYSNRFLPINLQIRCSMDSSWACAFIMYIKFHKSSVFSVYIECMNILTIFAFTVYVCFHRKPSILFQQTRQIIDQLWQTVSFYDTSSLHHTATSQILIISFTEELAVLFNPS